MALIGQISSSFWLNDYVDYEADKLNPRKIQVPNRNVLLVFSVVAQVMSLIAASLLHTTLFYLILIMLFLSVLYSVPPMQLKKRIMLPFCIHFVMGCLYFMSGAFHQPLTLSSPSIFWGLILATGSLINEIVDSKADQSSHIKTLANFYPLASWTLLFICHMSALGILAVSSYQQHLMVSAVCCNLSLLFYLKLFKDRLKTSRESFRQSVRLLFITLIILFAVERTIHLW